MARITFTVDGGGASARAEWEPGSDLKPFGALLAGLTRGLLQDLVADAVEAAAREAGESHRVASFRHLMAAQSEALRGTGQGRPVVPATEVFSRLKQLQGDQ